jgi:hypothetical protein
MHVKSSSLRTPSSTRRKQPRELTATEAAEIKQAFELFDTDRSGKIYYRELKVLHSQSGAKGSIAKMLSSHHWLGHLLRSAIHWYCTLEEPADMSVCSWVPS